MFRRKARRSVDDDPPLPPHLDAVWRDDLKWRKWVTFSIFRLQIDMKWVKIVVFTTLIPLLGVIIGILVKGG